MDAMSDFLELQIMRQIFGVQPWAQTFEIYVALFTATPGDDGTGPEISGNNYARTIVPGGWAITTPVSTAKNLAKVTFQPASGGAWGTITHMGLFDALTGGNLLIHGALTAPRTVNDTDTIEFDANAIVFAIS